MKALIRSQLVWVAIILIGLMVVNITHSSTGIIEMQNGRLIGPIINVFLALPPLLMVTIGMTLVIATSGIDLSVGSIMAVSGAVSMQLLADSSQPNSVSAVLGAVGLSLLIGAGLGAFSGILVSVVRLQPFITTLIMMIAGRGLANIITGGKNTSARSDTFTSIVQARVFGFPMGAILAFAVLIIVALVVRRTALGMTIEAVGINPVASQLAGIRSKNVLFLVYAVSGLTAAIAGVFSVAYVSVVEVSSTGTGSLIEMDAILAVVIGGTSLAGGKFSLAGSTLGAIVITALNDTVVYLGVSSAATPAFKAVVIIGVCLLQSERFRSWFVVRKPSQPTKVESVENVESTVAS